MDTTRKTKSKLYLRMAFGAVILAGMIILFTGIYYYVIKAGIPYQDPTLELQIQYAVNAEIGSTLIKEGFLIFICGGIGGFAYWFFNGYGRKGEKSKRAANEAWGIEDRTS